jgi:anaerobic selenocysteine-containing dehydrogenase
VVLPATTFLEHSELRRSYGYHGCQVAGPAVAPCGEARPNYEVFAALLRRMGLEQPGDPVEAGELLESFYEQHPDAAQQWRILGIAKAAAGDTPVQFVDVHPRTPDGKVHLVPPALDEEAPGGLYHYRDDPGTDAHPLALISPALAATVSSTFAQLLKGPAHVEVHPDDAAPRGIRSEDKVRLFNDLGEVHCRARITADVRPGTLALPKGLWARHTANGNTANTLAPDSLSDIGAGACFNDARVQLERLA